MTYQALATLFAVQTPVVYDYPFNLVYVIVLNQFLSLDSKQKRDFLKIYTSNIFSQQ